MTVMTITKCALDCEAELRLRLPRSDIMKYEEYRLGTFQNSFTCNTQHPYSMAEAGLYHTGIGDRVQCAFCNGVLKNWRSNDIPMTEHARHFPHCRFMKGLDVGNIPFSRNIVNIHIHGPVFNISSQQDFTTEATRLGSFVSWPTGSGPTPSDLARAGFHYVPTSERPDRVKCAYCQGKIYNWRNGDDPWLEHARCFPACRYVRLCLGENVANDIHHENISPQANRSTAPREGAVSQFMEGPKARSVLQMGFSSDNVIAVVKRYHSRRKLDSLTADVIVTELLDGASDQRTMVLPESDLICDSAMF